MSLLNYCKSFRCYFANHIQIFFPLLTAIFARFICAKFSPAGLCGLRAYLWHRHAHTDTDKSSLFIRLRIESVNVDSESSLWLRSAGRWSNGGARDGVANSSTTDSLHCVCRLHSTVTMTSSHDDVVWLYGVCCLSFNGSGSSRGRWILPVILFEIVTFIVEMVFQNYMTSSSENF